MVTTGIRNAPEPIHTPRRAGPPGARQLRCRLQGLHRAAFWRRQGFPNCARARAAWKRERHQLLIEQWKREELQRTRYAMFEDPPSYEELAARFKVSYRELAELRSMKSSRRK